MKYIAVLLFLVCFPLGNSRLKPYSDLTDDEFNELIESSNIGEMEVFRRDTLHVITNGEFTYFLLGRVPSNVTWLQHQYNNIFAVENQKVAIVELTDTVDVFNVNKLTYKNSFLKVFFNDEANEDVLISGRIVDREIILYLGIHIGISKKEFFNKIFAKGYSVDFHTLNVFRNDHYAGDIRQEFTFKADTLAKIILKANDGLIPFDL